MKNVNLHLAVDALALTILFGVGYAACCIMDKLFYALGVG